MTGVGALASGPGVLRSRWGWAMIAAMQDQSRVARSCPRNQLPGRFAPARATNSPGRFCSCRAQQTPGSPSPACRTLLPGLTRHTVGTESAGRDHAAGHRAAAEHRLRPDRRSATHRRAVRPGAAVGGVRVAGLVAASGRCPDAAAAAAGGFWPSRRGGRRHGTVSPRWRPPRRSSAACCSLRARCSGWASGRLLSKPILIGFVGGWPPTSCSQLQIAKMMGHQGEQRRRFLSRLAQLVSRLGTVHWWSLGLSPAAVAVSSRSAGDAHGPLALMVLIAATVASRTLHLPAHGVAVLRWSPPDRRCCPFRGWTGTAG